MTDILSFPFHLPHCNDIHCIGGRCHRDIISTAFHCGSGGRPLLDHYYVEVFTIGREATRAAPRVLQQQIDSDWLGSIERRYFGLRKICRCFTFGMTATMQQSNEGLCDTESDLSEEVESELESDEISDDIDDF